jgi:MFS family permease
MSPVKPGDATLEPNETTGLKSGGTANPPERKATAAAWLTLSVLTILNILNFIDRFLPDAYANFIMDDLNISAMQLGILSGFGFTAIYSCLLLVTGTLSDCLDRARLIAGGVCVWSLLTAASGFANSYAGLLVPRIFVGVGESVLAPCSLSLIPELFPPSLLAFASGCYLSAPHVGSGFAHILAGLTGNTLGWHASFWMMGGAGLLMGVSVPFLVRDPRQQAASLTLREAARKVRGSVRSSVGFVGGCPAIGYCIAGKFALGFTIGCHAMVQPWLTNERRFSREDADLAHGTLMLAIGVFSTPLVGFVADQFAQRTGKPKITLVAVQVAVFKLPVALCFFCLADPRSGSFWVLYACFVALQSVSAPVIATLQQLSPPTLRGSIIGLALLALYLPGMGMGNLVAGLVADHFTAAGNPYPYTIALASVYAIGCPLQALFYSLAAWRFKQDHRLASGGSAD